jgi:acyloxyacyl hydrolase
LPLIDFDGDNFSRYSKLRGFDWRGKDCNDFNDKIYPGRKEETGEKGTDYNCNGIKGIDQLTKKTWKEILCFNTGQQGIVVLGDSIGAHFSINPKYFNGTAWGNHTFEDLWSSIQNEFDLPYKSSVTGFVEGTETSPVRSVYKKLVERNRCNRNDYQNLGVNGDESNKVISYLDSIKRDKDKDFPILMILELTGSDVCDPLPSFDAMTTPEKFRENILSVLSQLNSKLPKGSHVFIWGLVDGRYLYDAVCIDDHVIHPVNETYDVFYDYMNCLQTNPC